MEWLLATVGAKFCCIFASTCGGAANVLTKKERGWDAVKAIGIAIVVGWISAEFLIPAAMAYFKFGPEVALGLAFLLGYAGVRVLPKLEEVLMGKIAKL